MNRSLTKPTKQQISKRYIIYVGAAIMMISLFFTQFRQNNQDEALGTATITDQGREYFIASLYGDIYDDDANGATIVITAVDDPACRTVDDETTFEITMTIPDVATVPINEDIDLSDSPFETTLSMTCYCDFDSGDANYNLSGTVQFTDLSTDFAEGTLSLTLDGDIPAIDGMLFAEDTSLELTIPLFRAPVSVDKCDY